MDVQGNRRCLGLFVAIILSMSLSAAKKPATGTPPPVTISGVEFQLVRIPAGEFQMGSQNQSEETELPRHTVRVRTFDLGKTEITVRQFQAFVNATGHRTDAEKEFWAWICCWSKKEGITWRNPGLVASASLAR